MTEKHYKGAVSNAPKTGRELFEKLGIADLKFPEKGSKTQIFSDGILTSPLARLFNLLAMQSGRFGQSSYVYRNDRGNKLEIAVGKTSGFGLFFDGIVFMADYDEQKDEISGLRIMSSGFNQYEGGLRSGIRGIKRFGENFVRHYRTVAGYIHSWVDEGELCAAEYLACNVDDCFEILCDAVTSHRNGKRYPFRKLQKATDKLRADPGPTLSREAYLDLAGVPQSVESGIDQKDQREFDMSSLDAEIARLIDYDPLKRARRRVESKFDLEPASTTKLNECSDESDTESCGGDIHVHHERLAM